MFLYCFFLFFLRIHPFPFSLLILLLFFLFLFLSALHLKLCISISVEVLLLPRGRGSFRERLESVAASLQSVLELHYDVTFVTWAPGQRTRGLPVLVVFQSQGRPGDEFPGALPQEFRGVRLSLILWHRSGIVRCVVKRRRQPSCKRKTVCHFIVKGLCKLLSFREFVFVLIILFCSCRCLNCKSLR